jgi:cytochrome c-type biogenesis protein
MVRTTGGRDVLDFVLAFGAGLLTLINPCVLPLLPLVAASAVSRHPLGPLAMALGLAVSFTIFGMVVFALLRATGLVQSDITLIGGWLMIGFGLVLLVPQAQAQFSRLAGATAEGGTRLIGQVEGRGLWGEGAAGALLGLAWSPCIGPTLGAAIGFAASGENLLNAFGIMLAFSAGAAGVVLALAYGTRGLIAQRKAWLMAIMPHAKTILGVGLILVGLASVLHFDRIAEAWAVENLPAWLNDLSVSL